MGHLPNIVVLDYLAFNTPACIPKRNQGPGICVLFPLVVMQFYSSQSGAEASVALFRSKSELTS